MKPSKTQSIHLRSITSVCKKSDPLWFGHRGFFLVFSAGFWLFCRESKATSKIGKKNEVKAGRILCWRYFHHCVRQVPAARWRENGGAEVALIPRKSAATCVCDSLWLVGAVVGPKIGAKIRRKPQTKKPSSCSFHQESRAESSFECETRY